MFRNFWQRRRVALVPAMILVAACGSSPASPTSPVATATAATAAPAATQHSVVPLIVGSSASAAPAASTTPVAIEALDLPATEIQPTAAIQTVAAYTFAVTGGTLWLGSPDGLVRIDPDTNTAMVVDPEP